MPLNVCLCDFSLWLLLVVVASAGFSNFSEKVRTSPLNNLSKYNEIIVKCK